MIRLALLTITSLTLAACVDQQPVDQTASVEQNASNPSCGDGTYPKPCVVPTMWNSATQNTISDFWFGIGASPSKVMYWVEMYGRSAAEVGGGETTPSSYVIYGAGAFDGTNAVWKAVEVKGSDIANYHSLRRTLYDTYELLGAIWDGGTGVNNGGSPGGHVGPHGFPATVITPFLDLMGSTRTDYGTKIQNGIRNFEGQ
jgi:hypothetical protein